MLQAMYMGLLIVIVILLGTIAVLIMDIKRMFLRHFRLENELWGKYKSDR